MIIDSTACYTTVPFISESENGITFGYSNSLNASACILTWNGKTLNWYATRAQNGDYYQLNRSNITYNWISIA